MSKPKAAKQGPTIAERIDAAWEIANRMFNTTDPLKVNAIFDCIPDDATEQDLNVLVEDLGAIKLALPEGATVENVIDVFSVCVEAELDDAEAMTEAIVFTQQRLHAKWGEIAAANVETIGAWLESLYPPKD